MAKKNAPSKQALEALKGFLAENQTDLQCEISLCLSDLPKTHLQKAKNGKIYADIVVAVRKEPDQWGRDLKVYMKPTAEDKAQNNPKNYVGGGRMITFAREENQPPTKEELDDLPF